MIIELYQIPLPRPQVFVDIMDRIMWAPTIQSRPKAYGGYLSGRQSTQLNNIPPWPCCQKTYTRPQGGDENGGMLPGTRSDGESPSLLTGAYWNFSLIKSNSIMG